MIIQSLLEYGEYVPDPNFAEHLQDLKQECSEFLSSPTLMLRGTDPYGRGGSAVIKSRIRTNRVSRSERHVGTVFFNAMIEEEFGVGDVRRRSHFMTNSFREAAKYGLLHFAFPVNGAKVLYNPEVADSMNNIGEIWHLLVPMEVRSHLGDGDAEKLAKCVGEMDRPDASIDSWWSTLDSLTPTATDYLSDRYWKLKNKVVEGYSVVDVGSIPTHTTPVEYMIFDAPHSYLVSEQAAAYEIGTTEGTHQQTFAALIQYIENL